ncbi:1-acyl-sn-glycerol-3-phosphate acyltransferase [Ruegeria pomeroyi]|uniref:1-acyl-sn-glycerol-3-phosphate acyltransferase n=1 Tax=Ruegeria alba TaxID=2916756 RepID=A0ABS9NSQ0_9RHOB|nr:lysophospholipid acyltransferase family protein [Ruegeria alba]MCE8511562.1 1-acyl-sn-glycerol-3-phosphate acyltransferase [Ruegeria pomeroyi]MCE8519993.1 1-acyl-sn-glycerol-3-phosphate acyltransferase [Ruegeria pomeroyi]MCE8523883.1 1-acyl-sn-glycerol-3-phosphate acyltransferase [Ruegeria pomeroyi]MCE8527767.1 1-acyl-sn-glycerol-3-phosphate acyltransferase [Ruegeria pomeroyi]MCE8532389.1 1-acyl-sn-glycerol-3-phosphate acyltransferase [Ruegeria pomeroyi]
MDPLWNSEDDPDPIEIGLIGWLLVLVRGVPLALLVFGGLIVLLLVRLVERPLCGLHRPVTPHITQFVCRNAFRILGIGFESSGELMREHGAVVANHTSWLDIFALNARKRVYFVSKAEVAKWPGIGWLARATGTVFIERNPKQARQQTRIFTERLAVGHKLLFFPEGTSTDGLRVLPFKTTLFAAFFAPELRPIMYVQPVSVVFHAPKGQPARFYGWWGDMEFGPHLLKTLAARRQGRVELIYHAPARVSDFDNRKELAAHCEEAVRHAHSLARLTK